MTLPGSWAERLAEAAEQRARGEWAAAEAAFESIVAAAVQARQTAVIGQALVGRTRVLHQSGRVDEATELAELACALAERCGLPGTQARALNILAVISLQRQEWDEARRLLERALEGAYRVRDDELVGAIATNLGAIRNIQGDLVEARIHYLESIGSNVRCEARAQLVMAYNNLGMVCSDSGEWMEALVYFGRALEIAIEEDDQSLIALLQVNQAEPLIETGELGSALATIAAANATATRLGNLAIQADAHRFLGRISRIRGETDEAERYLEQSLRVAEGAGLELHGAEALEEIALLHLQRYEHDAARRAFRDAESRYAALGAARDLARIVAKQREAFETSSVS